MRPKFLISLFFALVVSVLAGTGIAMACGVPHYSLHISGGLSLISLTVPQISGAISATVYTEVWTREVKKKLSSLLNASWLNGIKDYSKYVSNVGDEAQAIHLVYMGVEPDVLINNTTYPIAEQTLGEEDIVIQLDKLQTKVTPITDDELYALSYDKISTVKDSHATALSKNKIKKALHALAPSGNTAAMPVLVTTGADDGTGRKRMKYEDLVALKKAFDDLEYPDDPGMRRLVLCSDHVNDLLILDQKFKDQFYNSATGQVYNLLGFDIYAYAGAPYYVPATKLKKAFGAVPGATDRRASVAFIVERAARAEGWVKMYYSPASQDPHNQRNLVNFRHNFIVLPVREDCRGAIVSDNVPA